MLLAGVTLLPFIFMLNTAFKTNTEYYHSFFALPKSIEGMGSIAVDTATGAAETYRIRGEDGIEREAGRRAAWRHYWTIASRGVHLAWTAIRPYMLNTLLVCALTAVGVLALGSGTAYILARYRFLGRNALFMLIICTMMFPGVLTLVPSFLLVKSLGLLNSYWAMVLPFVASGQVFAIFLFKTFFEGLPEDLFESARIDGAGHLRLYLNIVLPLSKPVFSVVLVMNVLGTWNSFLWPLIVLNRKELFTLQIGLNSFQGEFNTQWDLILAMTVLTLLPVTIVFAFLQRYITTGIATTGMK